MDEEQRKSVVSTSSVSPVFGRDESEDSGISGSEDFRTERERNDSFAAVDQVFEKSLFVSSILHSPTHRGKVTSPDIHPMRTPVGGINNWREKRENVVKVEMKSTGEVPVECDIDDYLSYQAFQFHNVCE